MNKGVDKMVKCIGKSKYFDIDLSTENNSLSVNGLSLNLPRYEVNNHIVEGRNFEFKKIINAKTLKNGVEESKLLFQYQNVHQLQLMIYLRYSSESPFVRIKYELKADNPIKLTKSLGKDNIQYVSFEYKTPKAKLAEIQLGQFDPLAHAYSPCLIEKDESELLNCTMEFLGSCAVAECEGSSILIAYEHGAHYLDTYLNFSCMYNQNKLQVNVNALKGNYYDGQLIDEKHSMVSPWFHFAIIKGSRQELFHVFVIDTGWFDKTGDWLVNQVKFPDGLKEVKSRLNGYHMKLGLWFDPTKAAKSSKIMQAHPEYIMTMDENTSCRPIWETEDSYGMCLASDYKDYFISKMIELYKNLGVTYFKWDGINQYGCNSTLHNHVMIKIHQRKDWNVIAI